MLKLEGPLATLLKGSVISQFLAFALIPVVTFLYSPKEFGFYAELLNWALLISPIFAFGLERAIPYVHKKKQAPLFFRLVVLSLKSFLFLFLCVLIFGFLGDSRSAFFLSLALTISYLVFFCFFIRLFSSK
jgi:O-antigen/teichoic acid export membrane protein